MYLVHKTYLYIKDAIHLPVTCKLKSLYLCIKYILCRKRSFPKLFLCHLSTEVKDYAFLCRNIFGKGSTISPFFPLNTNPKSVIHFWQLGRLRRTGIEPANFWVQILTSRLSTFWSFSRSKIRDHFWKTDRGKYSHLQFMWWTIRNLCFL